MTNAPTDRPPFIVPVRLFDLGRIVATPGAKDACSPEYMRECLALHVRGDWGCVSASDHKSNFEALFASLRIFSAYPIDPAKPCKGFGENTLWIITEADRSVTNVPFAGRILTPPLPPRHCDGAGFFCRKFHPFRHMAI